MNSSKTINKILNKEWIEDLKTLPKYQRCEIAKAAKIYSEVHHFKMGVISKGELEEKLRELLKPNLLG